MCVVNHCTQTRNELHSKHFHLNLPVLNGAWHRIDVKKNKMLVEFVIFVVFMLLFWYHNVTKRWRMFHSRGLPYAEPYFPFGSVHIWKLLFGNVSASEQWQVRIIQYENHDLAIARSSSSCADPLPLAESGI